MRSAVCCLLVLAVAIGPIGPTVRAQTEARPGVFTKDAIRRAVSGLAADVTQAAPLADWSQVRGLPASTEIAVSVSGGAPKAYEFVQADDAVLTVIDRQAPGRPTVRIPRDQVSEIRRWTGRRGSVLWAVIGAGAGFFVGFGTAIGLATRDCEGSCTDEKVLVGLSLVGLPTAGGFLGYWLGGGNRTLTIVYKRN